MKPKTKNEIIAEARKILDEKLQGNHDSISSSEACANFEIDEDFEYDGYDVSLEGEVCCNYKYDPGDMLQPPEINYTQPRYIDVKLYIFQNGDEIYTEQL